MTNFLLFLIILTLVVTTALHSELDTFVEVHLPVSASEY